MGKAFTEAVAEAGPAQDGGKGGIAESEAERLRTPTCRLLKLDDGHWRGHGERPGRDGIEGTVVGKMVELCLTISYEVSSRNWGRKRLAIKLADWGLAGGRLPRPAFLNGQGGCFSEYSFIFFTPSGLSSSMPPS